MLSTCCILACVLLLSATPVCSSAPSTLRLVLALYRHGERTPVITCPGDPNTDHWLRLGLGQLTTAGMRMHYELGAFLRRRYSGFLPERYHQNHTHVRSANYDRTLMSAEANLAGLYRPATGDRVTPELAWRPVPVHTLPLSEDLLLEFATACARYSQQLQSALQLPEVQREVTRLAPLFRLLSQQCGIPVEDTLTAMYVYDLLDVERRLHRPLPVWYNVTVPHLNQRLFPELLSTVNHLSFRMLSFTPQLRRLGGGALLGQFVADMNATMLGGSSRRLLAYSGHDSDISALLGALGLFDPRSPTARSDFVSPPLASCVLLELHREHGSDRYFVRVVFRTPADRDSARQLVLPACSDGPDHTCLWTSLLRQYGPILPVDLEVECDVMQSVPDRLERLLQVVYVSLVFIVLLMISLCVLSMFRQRALLTQYGKYQPITSANKFPVYNGFYGSFA